MSNARDDFPGRVKRLLASRVANRCSNPECRIITSGPQDDPGKVVNIGVAAHITAASPGGPRYDASLTQEQRRAPENGIWLCQNCGTKADQDLPGCDVATLRQWKSVAEEEARSRVGRAPNDGEPAPRREDLIWTGRMLIDELTRNKASGGRMTGHPERKWLDVMIGLLEKRRDAGSLLSLLYQLERRTTGQESLADYGGSTSASQHRGYYVPAAEKAITELKSFIHQERGH